MTTPEAKIVTTVDRDLDATIHTVSGPLTFDRVAGTSVQHGSFRNLADALAWIGER